MWKITSDGTSLNTTVTYNGVVVGGIQMLSIGASAEAPTITVSLAIAGVELDIMAEDDSVTVTHLDLGFEPDTTGLAQHGIITEEMFQALLSQTIKGSEDEPS